MLFQSQGFTLIFLPLAVLAYYAVARSAAARQYVLIAASLVFYGWWDARFIPLLVGQITASWLLAVLGARLKRAWPLYAGIVLNLASLATFKYLDFLIGSLQGLIGVARPYPAADWHQLLFVSADLVPGGPLARRRPDLSVPAVRAVRDAVPPPDRRADRPPQ
jgi:D-alanyl-lipoteichoic acid acyltransferase DltB (MBOAT superfamily)